MVCSCVREPDSAAAWTLGHARISTPERYLHARLRASADRLTRRADRLHRGGRMTEVARPTRGQPTLISTLFG
jgi:hypothetical protein